MNKLNIIEKEEFKNHIDKGTLTLEIVKEWVDGCGDINIQDNNGWTTLYWASLWGHLEIVQYLVENGAKLDIQNKWGYTALMRVSQMGHLKIVKLLVENGAKLDIQNKDGYTALILTSHRGYLDIVQLLVEKGADINIQNKYGNTALYYQQENIQYIKIFLQSKYYSNKIKQLKRKNINFNQFINI
jgi:serine/threonine-protein phosphatase 6 regulatory ankyrin repeat subunit B